MWTHGKLITLETSSLRSLATLHHVAIRNHDTVIFTAQTSHRRKQEKPNWREKCGGDPHHAYAFEDLKKGEAEGPISAISSMLVAVAALFTTFQALHSWPRTCETRRIAGRRGSPSPRTRRVAWRVRRSIAGPALHEKCTRGKRGIHQYIHYRIRYPINAYSILLNMSNLINLLVDIDKINERSIKEK